jgi:hypothetical protein
MSRTIRHYPRGYFRYPRGRRQALINGVRHGAIPPDAYDDIPFSDHMCGWRIAEDMLDNGYDPETITKKLVKRFKGLSYPRAYHEIVKFAVKWHDRKR